VRVLRIVSKKEDTHWVTNVLDMDESKIKDLANKLKNIIEE